MKLRLAALLLLIVSCGVEVGNPHGKKGGATGTQQNAGALSLALADAPVDGAQHVYLNLIGASAIPLSATDPSVALDLAATGKIDALALNNGKSLALSSGHALPVGTYRGVVLALDESAPGTIVDATGVERPLNFGDQERSIYVAQSFEITTDEDLKLTLHVDLRRSIRHSDPNDDTRFDFGPVAHLIRQDDEATINGHVTEGLGINLVCAYLQRRNDFADGHFDHIPHHRPPGDGGPNMPPPPDTAMTQEGEGLPPPPPPGEGAGNLARHPAELPTSFAPDAASIDYDTDTSCSHAFAAGTVADGTFNLSHLWPGQYVLVYYKDDGTQYTFAATPIPLQPAQILAVAAPTTP